MDKGLFQSDAFLKLDPESQTKVAREHFKETLATADTYKALDQDQRNSVYNNFLKEVLPAQKPKGIIDTVVDGAKNIVHTISQAYDADQAEKLHKNTSAYQHRYEMSGGDELKRKDDAQAYAEHNAQKMEVRKAQQAFTAQPALDQLQQEILDMPERALQSTASGLATIPALVIGGEHTAKAVGDMIDTPDKFTKAYPELALAENIVADPTMIGSKVGAGEKVAAAMASKTSKAAHTIHTAAQDIIDSSAKELGLDIAKPTINTTIKDEAIAKVIADEHANPVSAVTKNEDIITDINVDHKPESMHIPDVNDMNIAETKPTYISDADKVIDNKATVEDTLLSKDSTVDRDMWHKDSHLLTKNDDGTPRVFYHGTTSDFNAFDLSKQGKTDEGYAGKGIYLTNNKSIASDYATGNVWGDGERIIDGGNVIPSHVNLKNPLVVDDYSKVTSESIKGHDGVIIHDGSGTEEIVAFYPEQIKSIYNRGTFDSSNPNILMSKGETSAKVHSPESMGDALKSSLGESISQRLTPIMSTISKADIPEAVLKEAGDSAEGIHGFVHEGKAYIVADNIPKEWSDTQIRGLVMHEVGVHLRKAGAEDKEFQKILSSMKESNDPIIKDAYARVPENTAAHRIDEEALAYLVQNHPNTGIVQKLIAWVKQQLIRLSISPVRLKMTPSDLSAMAWGAVKKGQYDPTKPNFVIVGDVVHHPRPRTEVTIPKYVQELGQLNSGKAEADLAYLKSKHPEIFKHEKEVFKLIRYVLYNTKHIVNGTGTNNTILLAKMDEKLGKIGLNRDSIPALVVHALKSSKKNEFTRLLNRQMEGSPTPSLPSSGTAAHGANAHSSDKTNPATHVGQGIASKTPSDQAIDGKGLNEEIIHPNPADSQEVKFSRSETQKESVPEETQSAGGFYSAAQKAIEKMPPKMEAEAFIKYLKNNGVKDDEILHSGIAKAVEGKESITKAEIEAAFSNPVIDNKVLESPKYEMYSLKDTGENYREELTVLPKDYADSAELKSINSRMGEIAERRRELQEIAGGTNKEIPDEYKPEWKALWNENDTLLKRKSEIGGYSNQGYSSGHWSEPNVLLHTRKQDTVIDGDKTLLVEEIQSDWHQDGRKMGYRDSKQIKDFEAAKEATVKLYEKYKVPFNGKVTDRNYNQLVEAGLLIDEDHIVQQFDNMAIEQNNKIPNAPMSKTWHEFGMRQIIDEAVAKGYDRVAWVDGATQANRYSMSHSVDRLVYNKNYNVLSGYKDGKEVMTKNADEGELEALIGKEPAKRLIDNEVHSGIHEIKGEALDIGGDGMKGFYDKILVDYAKKYTKKWGVSVEKKTLPNGVEVHTFPVNAKMREDVSKNGQALYAHGLGALAGVGEDENGNVTFDPIKAIAGTVGVSALMSKSVRNAISKVAAKAEYLSDSAARNIVIHSIKAADKITAGSITKLSEAISKSNLVDYVIGHKIYKLKDYMKLREDALRLSNAGMESAARLHLQLTELSSEAREAMYAYMTGDKTAALTPELKRAADTFVSKIDTMGKEMVDEGFLTKEAYDEWRGQYLHRKYASKIKKVSDWASGKGEFSVEKIHMRGKTWNATEEEYQQLLKDGQIGKVSEGKTEVLKDTDGGYKLRRDWTPEERKEMGEIRDVAYSLPETVGRMAQMIEFGKMLKSVPAKYMMEQGQYSESVMKQLGYEKLSGSRYGALNGKWVNQSIAGDLKRVSNDVMGEEANVKKLWNDYVSALKMSHTVYNPTAHVNNIGSNVFLQAAGGLNPFKTIKYATDGTLAARKYGRWKELEAKLVTGLSEVEADEFAKLNIDENMQLWKRLDEHRMFGRSRLNEMLRSYMSPSIDTTAGSALHKVSESMKALYQGEDDVMRFSAVKQLMNDGIWAEGEKSVMSIEDAMHYVNDAITPDYSKPMSKLALTLRDSGVVPFMSWTYYSTPILMKQLIDHPSRVAAIAAGWYGLDRLFGVDPYDDETMPKGFDAQRVAIARDGNKVTGMRVSSMIPHIQLVQPENTFIEPLTSGIPQTILGSATNYNFYFRKPITMKEGSEGTYQRVKDVVQNVLPSPDVLDKTYNIVESKVLSKEARRNDRVFEPRTPAQEAASFFVNLQTYDISKQRDRARRDIVKSKKREDKWGHTVDKAVSKLEKVFR